MRARFGWGVLTTLAVFACGDDEAAPPANPAAANLPPGCTAPAPGVVPDEIPEDLKCTGIYSNVEAKTLAPGIRPYTPAVTFWSDGFEKDRYIQLPDGQTIDASAVDDWKFPVGTKVWKEFRSGPRKIETRLFWKVSVDTWRQGAYVWTPDGREAKRGDGQDFDVDGKPYHVPKNSECNDCHRGRKDKLLGFEAISLSQPAAQGITLQTLVTENRIQPPPSRTTTTTITEPAYAALHVNCGITCHNATPGSTAFSTKLRMRLGFEEVATKPPEQWEIFGSSVEVDATVPSFVGRKRIVKGSPETSLIVELMKTRGGEAQMPPIATKFVDEAAVATISTWIRTLK